MGKVNGQRSKQVKLSNRKMEDDHKTCGKVYIEE